jgi:hypothetical protein
MSLIPFAPLKLAQRPVKDCQADDFRPRGMRRRGEQKAAVSDSGYNCG